MTTDDIRELVEQSKSDPGAVVPQRSTLYEPFIDGDDSGRAALKSRLSGDDDVPRTLAATGLSNLCAHDQTVAKEVAEELLLGEFTWTSDAEEIAAEINEQYPGLFPPLIADTFLAIDTDNGREGRDQLRAAAELAELEPALFDPHIEDIGELLQTRDRWLITGTLDLAETLLMAGAETAPALAAVLMEFIRGEERFDEQPTDRHVKKAFQPLGKTPPATLADTTPLISDAIQRLRTADRPLHVARYLGRVGSVHPDDVLPGLVEVLEESPQTRTHQRTLRAIGTIAENTDGVREEHLEAIDPSLSSDSQAVVWEAAAVFHHVAATTPALVEPYAASLVECLRRADAGELSGDLDPTDQMRDLERGSLRYQLLEALVAVVDQAPEAVAEAIPIAITDLADPETAPIVGRGGGLGAAMATLKEGSPAQQLLNAYLEHDPETVFTALLSDLEERDTITREQALVLAGAGGQSLMTVGAEFERVLALHAHECEPSTHPVVYLVETLGRERPEGLNNDAAVATLVDALGEDSGLDTAIGIGLAHVDTALLEPHIETLGTHIRAGEPAPNLVIVLHMCWVNDIEGAGTELYDSHEMLFELLETDDDTHRAVAASALLPVAEADPDVFGAHFTTLLYRFERGTDAERTRILRLFAGLVSDYPDKVAMVKEEMQTAVTEQPATRIGPACIVLETIGTQADAEWLQELNSRDAIDADDSDRIAAAIETITDAAES